MNNMKKFASILLALVMVLAMAAPAMAEGGANSTTYSITVPAGDTHQYEIYQVFTGTLEGNTLYDVLWGANGTGNVGTAVDSDILKEIEATDVANATNASKLEVILKYVDLDSDVHKTINGSATEAQSVNVVSGYYLIKDVDKTVTGDDTYTTYIVKVVGNVTIARKGDKPTLDKEVEEKNDSETKDPTWGDTADYDIGDTINYKLTATLPENYAEYKAYYLQFKDTMDGGLTYNKDAKVYAVNDGVETELDFTVTTVDNGFTVTCTDLKTLANANVITATTKIVVKYTATLNENAKNGTVGNKNNAGLEYSNNPNWDGSGEPDKGETPKDTTVVFTYDVIVNKVGEDSKTPLEGAGFTLYKWDAKAEATDDEGNKTTGAWVVVKVISAQTTFTFEGLDEGKYKLEETTVPEGYSKAEDIIFVIESTLDDEKETLTSLVVKDEAGNEMNTFDVTLDEDSGEVATTIKNETKTTLPSTGGAGTVAIYTVGGLLVAAAVVMMISKKRAASK